MKAIKIFITILSSVLVLICVIFFICMEWPLIIVNHSTLTWAAKHLSRKLTGLDLRWSHLEVVMKTNSVFEKKMIILLEDVCASAPPSIRTSFKSVELSFSYQFRSIIPKPLEIGPIRLLAGLVYVNTTQLAPASAEKETKKSTKPFQLSSWVKEAKLLPVELEIDHFHIENSLNDFKGNFKLTYQQNVLDIRSTSAFFTNKRPSGNASIHVRALTLIQQSSEQINYQLNGVYHTRFGSGTIGTEGVYQADGIKGTLHQKVSISKKALSNNFQHMPIGISNIELRNCHYLYLQTKPSKERGLFEFHCPLYFGLTQWKSQNLQKLAHTIELADRPLFTIETHLSVPFLLNRSKSTVQRSSADIKPEIKGRLSISPGKLFGPLVRTSGKLDMDVSLIPSEPKPLQKINGIFKFSSEIPEFHALVQRFSGTPLSVPTPLNALRGSTALHLSGHFTLAGGSLSINGNSRLSSPLGMQRIFTDFTGTTIVDTKVRPLQVTTNADIALSDVHIGLPQFSLGKLPQIFPDSRITKSQPIHTSASAKPKPTLHYKIHAQTRKPVQIEANFASAPIPIDLNLILQDPQHLWGSMTIERFPITVLGGKKEVKQISVAMNIQDLQNVPLGGITVNTAVSATEITASQLAGQAAGEVAAATSRSAPTFQIPLLRLLSSLLLGTPLNEVTTSPGTASAPPESLETEETELINIRKRF